MKIAYKPLNTEPLLQAPSNNDITFDLPGQAIYAKGVKFNGKTYTIFEKDKVNSEGCDGLIPAPDYNNGSNNRFLREDGQWIKIDHDIITYNPSEINLTTNWQPIKSKQSNTGFILNPQNGFSTGLYAIKITLDNLIFSGTASVYVGNITIEDEIVLHMSGIPQTYTDGTQGRIYAKIAPSETADYGELYLATNVPQSAIRNLSITMKKIL